MTGQERKREASPCTDCLRQCNYTQCREYRAWLNRCWNRYRRWPEQWRRQSKKENPRFWRYDSPTLLHDFMEKGPCPRCPARICCKDGESCAAYEKWTELRWQRVRKRLAGTPEKRSSCQNQVTREKFS